MDTDQDGLVHSNSRLCDMKLFREVCLPLQQALYEYFLKQTWNNVDDSEDLVHDTLIASLRSPQFASLLSCHETGEFRRWIFGVAYHRYAQFVRNLKRDRRESKPTPLEEIPTSEMDVYESLERSEERELLEQLVAKMEEHSSQQYSVCLLRFRDGLELHEIAARLRIPYATVRSRWNRGVNWIKEELKQRLGSVPSGSVQGS